MSQAFRTPSRSVIVDGTGADPVCLRAVPDLPVSDCASEPPVLTYRQAREILRTHEVHGPQCRQWLAAAAYLSAGLDDE
ncbi:hypothetical protein [Nocardia arthritidis]|uniref:Uncharacterized protein n=1 Tax=Nocardia arthritidis TaxID=228602 RepID=A0A6G9YFT5_9NOCA|nr:hypothetical protein [Nocardia arthritidis]QIS12081.1 hypothetical protein F5544_21090 [Nocardia arthritidis]